MELPPRVSVVICTHDDARFSWLLRAVRSARVQHPPPHELVVIVDHNPALLERARETIPDALVVPNAEAPGLSGGRNTGIRASTGDVIAFIDDDAEARPGWISGLLSAFTDRSVLGAGGAIAPAWQSAMPSWFPPEYLWVIGCSYRGLPTKRADVRNLIGCNMAFRRSVFEAVGGFRQGVGRGRGLPLGCEETELCIRASRDVPGGRFVYEPEAAVDHKVPASRGRIGYFLTRCFSEGISKAYVVRLVGASSGMRSERRYVMRTLTSGVARHLLSVGRGSIAGAARAAMIVAGLAAFGVGYIRGLMLFRGESVVATLPAVPRLDE